jgi:hypothetical protein
MSGLHLGVVRVLAGLAAAAIIVAAAVRLAGVPWYLATVFASYLAIPPSLRDPFTEDLPKP